MWSVFVLSSSVSVTSVLNLVQRASPVFVAQFYHKGSERAECLTLATPTHCVQPHHSLSESLHSLHFHDFASEHKMFPSVASASPRGLKEQSPSSEQTNRRLQSPAEVRRSFLWSLKYFWIAHIKRKCQQRKYLDL